MLRERTARKLMILVSLLIGGGGSCQADLTLAFQTYLKERVRLSTQEIRNIDQGIAVARILPTSSPSEVFVFGMVHIQALPEEYVRLALNLERYRTLPGYLDIRRIHRPPRLSDLSGFTLEPEDIQDLQKCRPGSCDLQLPASSMEELRTGIQWSDPNVVDIVNRRVQENALKALRQYQQNGNESLLTYNDKETPFDVRKQFQTWLERSIDVSGYLPKFNTYLLDYPHVKPPDAESIFFWEKVNFGLKPTLRLNHVIAYEADISGNKVHIVAVKQLYASHYFQLALDLATCIPKNPEDPSEGFYLATLKGSIQQGLTGIRGSIMRKVATGRTRSTQEKALAGIKKELEGK